MDTSASEWKWGNCFTGYKNYFDVRTMGLGWEKGRAFVTLVPNESGSQAEPHGDLHPGTR